MCTQFLYFISISFTALELRLSVHNIILHLNSNNIGSQFCELQTIRFPQPADFACNSKSLKSLRYACWHFFPITKLHVTTSHRFHWKTKFSTLFLCFSLFPSLSLSLSLKKDCRRFQLVVEDLRWDSDLPVVIGPGNFATRKRFIFTLPPFLAVLQRSRVLHCTHTLLHRLVSSHSSWLQYPFPDPLLKFEVDQAVTVLGLITADWTFNSVILPILTFIPLRPSDYFILSSFVYILGYRT